MNKRSQNLFLFLVLFVATLLTYLAVAPYIFIYIAILLSFAGVMIFLGWAIAELFILAAFASVIVIGTRKLQIKEIVTKVLIVVFILAAVGSRYWDLRQYEAAQNEKYAQDRAIIDQVRQDPVITTFQSFKVTRYTKTPKTNKPNRESNFEASAEFTAQTQAGGEYELSVVLQNNKTEKESGSLYVTGTNSPIKFLLQPGIPQTFTATFKGSFSDDSDSKIFNPEITVSGKKIHVPIFNPYESDAHRVSLPVIDSGKSKNVTAKNTKDDTGQVRYTVNSIKLVPTVNLLRSQNPQSSFLSPNGKKILLTDINQSKADITKYLCVKFEVRDTTTNQVLFSEQTGASDRMKWSMEWLNDKKIKLNSSDIGTYCWEEKENTGWAKVPC